MGQFRLEVPVAGYCEHEAETVDSKKVRNLLTS